MTDSAQFRVVLYSFGFKYGTPVDVNLVLDVRFLPNPYWVEELRPKTGKVKEVANHVLQSSPGQEFFSHIEPLLQFLIAENSGAGKKTIRIAIGCTGGRHRSVAVTEKLAASLQKSPIELIVFHRDIDRDTTLIND